MLMIALVAVLVPANAAQAAKAKFPSVSRVAPLKLAVGETLTITGRNFAKGKNKTTVVFKRDGKAAIFAKARTATKRKLTVVVPEKLSTQASPTGTRFRIRILAKRFGKRYTSRTASPLISAGAARAAGGEETVAPAAPAAPPAPPADCDADGTPDETDADDDNDKLLDADERAIGTEPCRLDTDGDGLEDGWEYKSAVDLNTESCPATAYPHPCAAALPDPRRLAYPNPLDGGDAGVDYDGDCLTSAEEHAAWKRHGERSITTPWYSAGLQSSIDDDPANGCKGLDVPAPLLGQAAYSIDRGERFGGNGCLSDDERDEDGDYLTNYEEAHNVLSTPGWWRSVFSEQAFWIDFRGTDWLQRDTDGDRIVDGMDDQDHDDFWNVEEISRGTPSAHPTLPTGLTGLWVDPFNPCLPSPLSRSCPVAIPVSGEVWPPFWRDAPRTTRWPLYGRNADVLAQYGAGFRANTEQWSGLADGSQTLPPAHPLLPRPS
jgi:hypothetical protein